MQEGLLVKESAPDDRRTVVSSLSKAGKKRAVELDGSLTGQAEQIIGRIPQKQRHGIYESLRLLRDALRAETNIEASVKAGKAKCAS